MTNIISDEAKVNGNCNGCVEKLKGKDAEKCSDKQKSEKEQEAATCVTINPPPPDGGWGWIVVIASFLVHVITDGITYSFGNFHSEIKSVFNQSEADTAWVSSILVGVTLSSGPISSFLVNLYGCQAVTIAGSILAAGSLFLCQYATKLWHFYLTAGLGTGLGFGLIYLPAIVSVTIYFEKRRSVATGIAVCGSGIGTFLLSPILRTIISKYGWQTSFVVISLLVLCCIFLGMTFRPLTPAKTAECVPLRDQEKETKENGFHQKDVEFQKIEYNRRMSIGMHDEPPKYSEPKSDNTASNNRLALSQPILIAKDGSQVSESGQNFARASCGSGIMNRSDIFLRSSIRNISKQSDSLCNSEDNLRLRLSLRSLPNGAGHRALESTDNHDKNNEENIVKKMLDTALLKDSIYIIFTVSNFLTSIGFNVPYIFINEYATSAHINSDDVTYFIPIIGIANTIGRIVLGYYSDKPGVNRLFIYSLCLTICGLATASCGFCESLLTIGIYSAVFGFTSGAYVGLTSVCLVDLVGLDHLTNAFGILLLAQGVASFLGAPIAGAVKDATGNFTASFLLVGIMITISGLILYLIPPIQIRRAKNSKFDNMMHKSVNDIA